MSQILFLRFPLPVALALVAMLLILLGVARVLATLGKPAPLRSARAQHDPAADSHSAGTGQRPH